MKTAILVSGLLTSAQGEKGILRNNARLKEKFPEDVVFLYGTYEQYKELAKKLFPNEQDKFFFFSEPVPHYHPYLDIDPKNYISKFYQDTIDFMKKDKSGERMKWSRFHNNQHIVHCWLFDQLIQKYNHGYFDCIVRTRFDTFINKTIDFDPFLDRCKNKQISIGFAATKKERFNQCIEFDQQKYPFHQKWMCDQLIIHPEDVLNTQNVYSLYFNKKLHAAEYGWYQILSSKSKGNHVNIDGVCNHDKSILPKFLEEK